MWGESITENEIASIWGKKNKTTKKYGLLHRDQRKTENKIPAWEPRGRVQEETSSLAFGYGLRNNLQQRWRHQIVNKASELFPILEQGTNSSVLISNCSFVFVYQASFIKLFSKGQMWCVFLVLLWFSMTLPEWLNNKRCMSIRCSADISTGALDHETTPINSEAM